MPRTVHIYSSDGTNHNTYTIKINVHQEEGDTFSWQQMGPEYLIDGPDATTYYQQDGSRLIGWSTTELYRLTLDKRLLVSRNGGDTWEEELLDEDASMLPVQDICIISYPANLADSTDYVLMVGNRSLSEYPQESIAMVWRKIVDYSVDGPKGHWTYMEHASDTTMALPRLENLRIVKYDDGVLALGGAGIGGCTTAPYTQFYQSRDNGITWKYNARYQLPAGFDTSASYVQMRTDENNFLWLYSTGTNQVWRGRLNRLGWEK